jgi:hypothetical protein
MGRVGAMRRSYIFLLQIMEPRYWSLGLGRVNLQNRPECNMSYMLKILNRLKRDSSARFLRYTLGKFR